MDNENEEQALDYVALVEEMENQIKALCKTMPLQICSMVDGRLEQAGKVKELQNASAKAVQAAQKLQTSIKRAGTTALILILAFPAVVLAIMFWQTQGLRTEKEELTEQVRRLSAMAEELSVDNPNRLGFVSYGDGSKGVILPPNTKYKGNALLSDGRVAMVYAQEK